MNRTKSLVGIGLMIIAGLLAAGVISAFVMIGNKVPQTLPTVATSTQTISTSTTTTKPGIPVPTVHTFGSTTLSLGETARYAGMSFVPLSIVEDSRCPVDVQCIQAGTVRVSTRITTSSGSVTQTLTLNQAYTIGGTTITLTAVQPTKHKSSMIAPSDYRLTFDVEKGQPVAAGKCYVGGCSSEVCSDQPGAVSNCIYTAAFGCYRTATCERQASGSCGWTQTEALKSCLANPPGQEYTL